MAANFFLYITVIRKHLQPIFNIYFKIILMYLKRQLVASKIQLCNHFSGNNFFVLKKNCISISIETVEPFKSE